MESIIFCMDGDKCIVNVIYYDELDKRSMHLCCFTDDCIFNDSINCDEYLYQQKLINKWSIFQRHFLICVFSLSFLILISSTYSINILIMIIYLIIQNFYQFYDLHKILVIIWPIYSESGNMVGMMFKMAICFVMVTNLMFCVTKLFNDNLSSYHSKRLLWKI